jgi:EmrB/QacA subfamily drug resistance transporter
VAGNRTKWLTLVAMTGALSMVLIDETVVSVALPSIQRDLNLSSTTLQWVVNAYLLVLAALVAVAGRLSDNLGRVRFFIAGVALFAGASATAGLATEAWHILASRSIQGIGAAMMIPSSQAIVTNTFPVEERGRAMGIYAGISMAFLALGPLLGGLLTEHLGWEYVFFVNLPVAAMTITLTLVAHPVGTRIPSAGRFDWLGTALIVPGLACSVFALMQSAAWGWTDPAVIGLLATGLILIAGFVLLEPRLKSPLVELSLFRSGNFAADSFVLFAVQFALMGVSVFGAIYSQDVLGFSPAEAGLALLPLTIPILLLAMRAGKLYDRVGARAPVTFGTAAAAAAFFGLAFVVLELDYWYLVPFYVVLGIGIPFIMTPGNTDGMNAAPAALRGQASGLLQTVRQVGGTIGIAILTSVILSVYHGDLDKRLTTSGVPSSEVDTIERSLAESPSDQSVYGSLPPQEVEAIREDTRKAYATGLRAAYFGLAVFLVLACGVAFAKLRRVQYHDDPVPAHPLAAHASDARAAP